MRKSQHVIYFFILTLLSYLMLACSTKTDLSEAYPGKTPQQIFSEGKHELKNGNNSEAIKRFEALDVQYPDNEETQLAQFYIIYAYYKKEEYALAVNAADRYLHLHPQSENAPYALYMRGLANYHLNIGTLERYFNIDLANREISPLEKSFQDFKELEHRYPRSIYTPSAHQYALYLRNLLAEHELHIAQYYYERGAFVASANRASSVILHYQGAPSVVPALVLLAKSYHQLNMTKLEQDTLSVLKYNYPEAALS